MIYSLDKAKLIQEQIRRLTILSAHNLSGHIANFDYWISEIESALEVLSKYNKRFDRMRDAQKKWVDDHGYTVPVLTMNQCSDVIAVPEPPSPPKRYSRKDIESMHKELSDTAYEFFLRCHKCSFIELGELKDVCERIGTGLDPNDLKRKNKV